MKIIKAIIPAAGFGTRMLPVAKAVPKELLPVLDRPTIQYVVEEAADAGIQDVLMITGRDKRAIEDHFDRAAELEARLAAGNKSSLLASIDELCRRVRIHSVRQGEQKGLGHAVMQARQHVGDAPCLCLLGDTIFSHADPATPLPSKQLTDAYSELGTPIIALEEVAAEKVDRYGIVGGREIGPGVWRIESLVEKPSRESAPSRLAIAARYVLTPDVFECLDQTPPGKGGEIQLTDALKRLLERRPIHGVVIKSARHDIGNPTDWLKTNLIYASRDARMWEQLGPLIRKLLG